MKKNIIKFDNKEKAHYFYEKKKKNAKELFDSALWKS